MSLLKKSTFEELAKHKNDYCLSVYIPTHRSGENADSVIRFKNQLSDIEKTLAQEGLKPREIQGYMDPLRDLEKNFELWQHMSDAFMVFRSKDKLFYTTLPIQVEEFSLVSNQFYLLPLLSIFNSNDQFLLLTLSQGDNKLYLATQHEITPMDTKGILPDNIQESVGYDVEQKNLQYRSGQTQSGTGMYHGQGEGKDDKDTEILKYLNDVSHGLDQLLEGYAVPLVVASVDHVFAKFKEVANYNNIFSKNVSGNYEEEQITLVHEKAKELLAPYFNESREKQKETYHEAKDKKTNDIEKIVNSANDGAVDTLFVSKSDTVWGEYNEQKHIVVLHQSKTPTDYCLLDLAAKKTFLNGGKVFREDPEQLPDKNTTANALLRF